MKQNQKGTGTAFYQTGAFRFTVLALLYWLGLYFANYLTVYLQALGMSSTVVGYVSSAAAATGMIGNFVLGRLSDRYQTVKWVTIITLVLTGLLFILFPLTSNVVVFGVSLAVLWWPIACLFRSPGCTLVENWIVRSSYSEHFNYGLVRAGGSIGSFLSSVLASALVTALYAWLTQEGAVAATYYVGGGLLLISALYALSVPDVTYISGKAVEKKDIRLSRLLTNYHFMALLFFYFALNVFINPPYVFLPYIMEESGIDTGLLGIIVGWEALLELPLLFLLVLLRKRFKLYVLLIAGGLLFAVTSFGQSISTNLPMLLVCGVFFGFGNSLSFSCGFNYIYCIAPKEIRATAHTLYTIAGAVGITVGNLVAGILIDQMGARPFYKLFAILTAAVCLLYAGSFVFGKAVLHKDLPDCQEETEAG